MKLCEWLTLAGMRQRESWCRPKIPLFTTSFGQKQIWLHSKFGPSSFFSKSASPLRLLLLGSPKKISEQVCVYIYIAPIEGGQGEGSSKFQGKNAKSWLRGCCAWNDCFHQDLNLAILKIIQYTVTCHPPWNSQWLQCLEDDSFPLREI